MNVTWSSIFLGVTLASGILAISGWLITLRYLRGSGEKGACCGRCGYSTRALTSFDCPECGGDLREVGIVPPRRRLGTRSAALLALVLTVPMTTFVVGILMMLYSLAL